MNILYDHQAFTLQRFGGVSRYFAELIRMLSLRPGVRVDLGVFRSLNEHLLSATGRPGLRAGRWARGGAGAEALRLMNGAVSLWHLSTGRHQVFHPTYYNPYFLRHVGRTPFVVTVFDMIHELMPEVLPPTEAGVIRRKRLLVGAATHIVAISHTTKRDLVRLYGIDEKRISVIHLAHSLEPRTHAGSGLSLPGEYILFVGKRAGYKNFATFLEAAAPILLRRSALHLLCVGGGPFTDTERAECARLGIADRATVISVTDADLPTVYTNARMFVFPSRYEGFGIPLLEAFACRCPVAAADTDCFREICEDAAVYFPPDDAAAMASVITRLLDDVPLVAELREKGTIRSGRFSWTQTADRTLEVYSRLQQV